MDVDEIRKDVIRASEEWTSFQSETRLQKIGLSAGAIEAFVLLIANIEQDRSPSWADFDVDSTQREAISMIPNALNELPLPEGRLTARQRRITSWEIWHQFTVILDTWCPIKKDL